MKFNALVIALSAALLAGPAFSQPVEPSAVLQSGAGNRLVIGAAGTVQGVSQIFRTHLMLANFRNTTQLVRIDFLAEGVANSEPETETLALEPRSFSSRTIPWNGLGSLVLTAVNEDGTDDSAGSFSAIARIYSGDSCGDGTVSQSFKAERVGTISGATPAYILGLAQDRLFRTNVGVVNLDPVNGHAFEVRASGQGGVGTTQVSVPPMSMVQIPLPEACEDGECTNEYGDLVVTVDPTGVPGDWFAYGSSVHNGSGDAWVSPAIQVAIPE
ncbi:MAG: hypothetical protein ABR517_00845 [Thermoanaerobaculia bacterium]